MFTDIRIWSANGHTPITNRGGAFCDQLSRTAMHCKTPADARKATLALIATTAHAVAGHFNMPDHPNQNIRSAWVTGENRRG